MAAAPPYTNDCDCRLQIHLCNGRDFWFHHFLFYFVDFSPQVNFVTFSTTKPNSASAAHVCPLRDIVMVLKKADRLKKEKASLNQLKQKSTKK